MPHIIVEYTDNIHNDLNINEILQGINDSLISHKDLFSANGIRSRAVKLTNYKVGTGLNNDAFIHVTVKIASGRTKEAKETVLEQLFKTLETYVEQVPTDKKLSLSLELSELNSNGDLYKQI